jgi:glyoxylase-like metal-dependent hydrolase (beta-lactamase superfamily II)
LDDYPVEWSTTLRRIAELDIDVLVPGHGEVQHDLDYLNLVADLFASLGEQVQAGIDRGWDRETITANVDLEAPMRAIAPDRENLARRFTPGAVAFAYRELMERAER